MPVPPGSCPVRVAEDVVVSWVAGQDVVPGPADGRCRHPSVYLTMTGAMATIDDGVWVLRVISIQIGRRRVGSVAVTPWFAFVRRRAGR
jgi:hypothetical protein